MEPARLRWASAVCLIAMGVMAFLIGSPVAAQTEGTVGESKVEGTAATSGPTEAATAPATNDPGTGGIVVSPAPTEPVATEPVEEGENPGEPEGVPTEDGNNEGVAPAVVVVVLWTADGGSVSDRTTVCVSEICQPVGAVSSGTKIEFPRIAQGWHDISVVDAGAYENGFSSVSVSPGQFHTAEVTLAVTRPVEESAPTPPPGADGPIRSPIQVVDGDGTASRETNTRFASNVSVPDDTVLRVSALPETGTGDPGRGLTGMPLALGAGLVLALAAMLARRRAA
jgi:hypothetical protein